MRIERKKNRVRILAALLLAALLLAVPPVRAEQQEGDELPEWTVVFYLCGSDLQEDACEDLMEMAEVEAGLQNKRMVETIRDYISRAE